MCEFYDPSVVEACVEDNAEEVRDKERANFCDYFKPIPDTYQARDSSAAQAARTELDTLFSRGSSAETSKSTSTRRELDELFGDSDDSG